MGFAHVFFFFRTPMFLFFISWARRPWAAHVFFSFRAPIFLFFLEWAEQLFFTDIFGMDQPRPRVEVKLGLRDFLSKIMRPWGAHLFFLFLCPIFFKKKIWADFFCAHFPPRFFFFPAHVSAFPIDRRERGTRYNSTQVNRRWRGTRYNSPKLIVK